MAKFKKIENIDNNEIMLLINKLDIDPKQIEFIWCKRLPSADVIQKNKPINHSGNTSHIAVTTDSMEVFDMAGFFPPTPKWLPIDIMLAKEKVHSYNDAIKIVSSYMAVSHDIKKNQYKIGKKSENGNAFNNLRDELQVDDYVCFVKTQLDLFAVGVDSSVMAQENIFYVNNGFIEKPTISKEKNQESDDKKSLDTLFLGWEKKMSDEAEENDSKTITVSRKSNLSADHENMKKQIYSYFYQVGWKILEENYDIDVLTTKDNKLNIIEVKSSTEGKDSIFKAIGQVLYYYQKLKSDISLDGVNVNLIIIGNIKGLDEHFKEVLVNNNITYINFGDAKQKIERGEL